VQHSEKERFVIFNEERVGERARVTIDEEVCCDKVEQKIKLWRY